jgi:hypothetical protein
MKRGRVFSWRRMAPGWTFAFVSLIASPKFSAIIPRMHLSFVHLSAFAARWKEARLGDDDLRALEHRLLEDPEAGAVMGGTGGLRKIRFAPPSRRSGKSGAYRICYVLFPVTGWAVLFTIFAKSNQANLNASEKAQAKKVIAAMRKRLGE